MAGVKSKSAKAAEAESANGAEAQPKVKKKLFAVAKKVVEATSGPDLNNLELALGDNKVRILGEPILVGKHWDLPESSELTTVPCAKVVTDLEAYAEDPEGHLETLDYCPYCELEKTHGGKDGFYNRRDSWVFNVGHNEGEKHKSGPFENLPVYTVKVAEFSQKSIINGIADFEAKEDWQELMPNGIEDLELIITKVEKKGKGGKAKTEYSVGAVPTSKPLPPEYLKQLRDKSIDLAALKRPPDEEGYEALLKKAGEPEDGEKPKKPKY